MTYEAWISSRGKRNYIFVLDFKGVAMAGKDSAFNNWKTLFGNESYVKVRLNKKKWLVDAWRHLYYIPHIQCTFKGLNLLFPNKSKNDGCELQSGEEQSSRMLCSSRWREEEDLGGREGMAAWRRFVDDLEGFWSQSRILLGTSELMLKFMKM